MDFIAQLIIIIFSVKVAGHISKKLGQPALLGKLLVGVILGPSLLGWVEFDKIFKELAGLGVLVLMFLAGLETDVSEFQRNIIPSTLAALGGVLLPLILGTAFPFFIGFSFKTSIFIAVILVATSVSISVQTLRELGKLNSSEGMTILGAAVIDDILGLIILSLVLGLGLGQEAVEILGLMLVLKIAGFFLLALVLGYTLVPVIMGWSAKVLATEGILTFALIIALVFALISQYFGLAGIVGAYIGGIMVKRTKYNYQLIQSIETLGNSFFFPLFFFSVGINVDITALKGGVVLFTIIMSLIAIFTKVVGSGLGTLLAGFNLRSSLIIGSGMISRGEVALIVANIGLKEGIISVELFTAMIMVTLITTVITPPLLKLAFN